MKTPKARGAPIDARRMRRWTDEFSGYRVHINEGRIDRWLAQFERKHRDTAARVLDIVDFISHEQISAAFRSLLNGLPGWHKSKANRQGTWRFVPFSFAAGESGDTMLHTFRVANGLSDKRYNELFIHMRDLPGEQLTSEDTVVFVDDFSGSGKQAVEIWNGAIAELLPGKPKAYLMLVSVGASAANRIDSETELTVVAQNRLRSSDNFFDDSCSNFDAEEKQTISRYCRRADSRNPKGYGDCGFVVVFAHRCPNNSLPILHASSSSFDEPLFRRHE